MAFMLAVCVFPVQAKDNVFITGQLVTQPCVLDPTTTTIPLDFGDLADKDFYRQGGHRTPGIPFVIRLQECDTSSVKNAFVTFSGKASTALPGLLATDSDGIGIAFGFETDANPPVALPINKKSNKFPLKSNPRDTEIALRGYVQAEPDAITNHSIQAGPFSGTATFQITYQ
jgi:type 1 fimbria pilin